MTNSPQTLEPELLAASAWRAWPHTFAEHASDGRWIPYRHLVYISEQIALAIAAGNGRVIVNAPPRHAKSWLTSWWLPLWYLEHFPERQVILATYGADFSTDWGRKVRDEFRCNPHLMTKLSDDSKAADRWHTPQGGGMVAVGVGGPITGRGGDLIIVDDPIKNWQEAQSYVARGHLVDWFESVLTSRAEPNASIVVTHQRWHEDDLSGHLAKQSTDWNVISLPALAEKDDQLGREPGEPLCPERYDVEALKRKRREHGAAKWNAMYRQQPSTSGMALVYPQFSIERNVDDSIRLAKELPLQVSFDFNSNPGMHLLIGQHAASQDLLTCFDEIYAPGLTLRDSVTELLKRIESWGGIGQWPELHIFGDASGKSELTAVGVSHYMMICKQLDEAKIRYRIRVLAANPAIVDRVNAFNDALFDTSGKVHYICRSCCQRLIADFRQLKTDPDPAHSLIDKRQRHLSHASDSEGYRVHYLRPLSLSIPEQTGGRFIFA